jgi:predicted lactoylglutathione lyase
MNSCCELSRLRPPAERSKAFFAKLGFSYNPMFTDETAACMLVGEHAFVMLLSREKFAEFAKLPIADPTTHTLALYCFSVSSRDEVDTVSAAALAAGGSEADDAEDYGFMYSRSFFDLDGHGWQVMDGSGGGGAGPRGVRGLYAGRRGPDLTRHVPRVRHRRAVRQQRAASANHRAGSRGGVLLCNNRLAVVRRRAHADQLASVPGLCQQILLLPNASRLRTIPDSERTAFAPLSWRR